MLGNVTAYWAVSARIAAVLVLSYVAIRAGDMLIARVFMRSVRGRTDDRTNDQTKGRAAIPPDSRAKTLAGLLRSTLRYAVGATAFLTVLDLVGIDTKALLGGAAILGLAVGFGAQNLVRDVISGFFIIYERQYDVGDYITAAGLSGFVEEIGLRITRLRDYSGDVHVIPNGLIDKTTNKSRAGSAALVDITIALDEDARRAIEVLKALCQQMGSEVAAITDGPVVLGVSGVDSSGITIRLWVRTKPLEHFGVERELRLRAKEALDKAGIKPGGLRVTVVGPTSGPSPGLAPGPASGAAADTADDTATGRPAVAALGATRGVSLGTTERQDRRPAEKGSSL